MRVLILGGDGYLGWPTAMHLSARGHEVMAVDNYLRRRLARETDSEILFETPNLSQRAQLWHQHAGRAIQVRIGDLTEWSFIAELFESFRPDAVVHYAEQPSAPYSMLDRRAAELTLKNNLGVTFNVIQNPPNYAVVSIISNVLKQPPVMKIPSASGFCLCSFITSEQISHGDIRLICSIASKPRYLQALTSKPWSSK